MAKLVKKAVLINDCVAAGFGLTDLKPSDAIVLHHEGGDKTLKKLNGEPVAAVVMGTGLGAVYLTSENG